MNSGFVQAVCKESFSAFSWPEDFKLIRWVTKATVLGHIDRQTVILQLNRMWWSCSRAILTSTANSTPILTWRNLTEFWLVCYNHYSYIPKTQIIRLLIIISQSPTIICYHQWNPEIMILTIIIHSFYYYSEIISLQSLKLLIGLLLLAPFSTNLLEVWWNIQMIADQQMMCCLLGSW